MSYWSLIESRNTKSMIRESGNRFREKIMRNQKL